MITKETKLKELITDMKKVSAEIGKLQIERGLGKRYVSVKEIDAKRREFAKLQSKHKALYFS